MPEWFNKELKQTFLQQSLTDAKDAVIVAFETMIINKIKNLKGSTAFDNYRNTFDRLMYLVENKLLPFCKEMYTQTDHKLTFNLAFFSGVLREIQAEGVTNEQLPNLSTFVAYFEGRMGVSHGKHIAIIDMRKLLRILDIKIEDVTNSRAKLEDFDLRKSKTKTKTKTGGNN